MESENLDFENILRDRPHGLSESYTWNHQRNAPFALLSLQREGYLVHS